jgi:hypothetical protein
MATIARTAKTGGGTNFNPNQTISSNEANTDLNTIVTEINGALDDANIETATIPGAKSLRFTEISAPSSPSSNDILLYAKDSSGTTRLYTKDASGTERAVGAGEIAYLRLPIEQATLPNGTASNVPAEIAREVSSGTTANAPSPTQTIAKFDAATDEHLCWSFLMPSNYSSGGTLRFTGKAASATSGAAYLKAGLVASIDSSTDDDAVAYLTPTGASWSAPATQGQPLVGSIALTVTNVAANRKVELFFGRDADGTLGTDDMTGDFYLLALHLEYVPA